MKLIVGLGNPGRKYDQTRHNVGFVAANKVAVMLSAGAPRERFEAECVEATLDGEKLIVICPQTYMNASGKSVRKAVDFFKLSPDDVLVICDDLNLPTGKLRLRRSGSAGGQKGLADIIRQLGTDAFPRLRLGVDRPPPEWNTADYVLAKFPKEQHDTVEEATTRAAKAALQWATEGVTSAMNHFNADPNSAKQKTKPQRLPPADGDPDPSSTAG